jgi:hypothetical protein
MYNPVPIRPITHTHTHRQTFGALFSKQFLLMAALLFLSALGSRVSAQADCFPEIPYSPENPPEAPKCQDFTINMEVGSGTSNPNATTAFPSSNSVSGQNILVSGTFTLNKTMTFTNCRVFFEEGSELVTSGAVTLIGQSTWFAPCEDKTWGSIVIQQNGAIQLEDCSIAGADRGITLRKGYKASLSSLVSTSFSQCRIGIFSNEASTLVSFSSFHGNRFNGSGTLPSQPTVMPDVGIQVLNGTLVIGTAFDYQSLIDEYTTEEYLHELFSNQFTRLRVGIELGNSRATVRNCFFDIMRPEPDANGTPQSAGISIVNGDLLVTGSNAVGVKSSCKFNSCGFAGIRTVRAKLQSYGAEFNGSQLFGIHSTGNIHRAQLIKDNYFLFGYDEQMAGISVERPGGAPLGIPIDVNVFQVADNVFEGNSRDGLACIEVRCPYPSVGSRPALVTDNVLDMDGDDGQFYGILVYGNQTNNIHVLRNVLDISGGTSTSEFGIFTADCEGTGHQVSYNSSTGSVTCNFHIERSRNIEFCDNTTNTGGNGFHFMGDNLNAFWSVNNIGDNGHGLWITDAAGSGGRMGPQTRRGNLWESSNNMYVGATAARCDADFTLSPFLLEEENDNSIFPQETVPADGWFNFEDGPLEHCTGLDRFVSDFETRFAAGEIDTTLYGAAERWELKRRLLRTLLDYPDEADDDGVLEAYLAAHHNSTAGRFAKVERMMADDAYVNATDFSQAETKYEQYEGLLHEIDSLTHATTFSEPTVASKLQSLSDVADTIVVLTSDVDLAHYDYLEQVLDTLNAITVTQPYEQAWKTLKVYEVKIAMGYTPAAAGYADLENISSYDPVVYGAAVRHAIHHQPECRRYALLDPLEGEEERVLSSQANHQHLEANEGLLLQPNPAADEVLITLRQPMAGRWQLLASSGQIARMGDWADGETAKRIDTGGLAPGVYFFQSIPDAGKTVTQKLIIAR